MERINVGIDLGTTYSAVAKFSNKSGKAEVLSLKNIEEREYTPSVICIENGKVTIGTEAKDEQKNGNVNTAAFYKSMMGDKNWSAYIDNNSYSAEELSGMYLKELVGETERIHNVKIDGAVITVPAYFNDKQREATIRAGQAAGLNVLKIINEPTAAIIAFGLTGQGQKNILVYDLGGGTFDVTIAHVNGTQIDVLTTNGNHQLGGKDWDQVIFDDLREKFEDEFGVDVNDFEADKRELQVKCEIIKKKLGENSSVNADVYCNGLRGRYTVTAEEFEERTETLLQQTIDLIESCFRDLSKNGKKFGWKNIDEVVLVGGSTRMPQVRRIIKREYGKDPKERGLNVETVVAEGAAIQAELCVNKKVSLSLSPSAGSKLGSGSLSGQRAMFTLSSSDIMDITAHSLGMLALAKDNKTYKNSIIIPKNSKVNLEFGRNYEFTGAELQVYVLQGESDDPYENDILGMYLIKGMRGGTKEKIKVNFLYNSNGVVEVHAQLEDGTVLSAQKVELTEDMSEIIARLEREREKAEEERLRKSSIEVMLIIDTSGSMWTTDGPNGSTRIDEAKKCAVDFAKSLLTNPFVKMSVVAFADKTEYACKWSDGLADVIFGIQSVDNVHSGSTNGTPISDRQGDFSSGVDNKIMVILTDGEWFRKGVEFLAAQRAKAKGIKIYGIGIGSADKAFLDSISSGKGLKVDISQLNTAFQEVAASIATEAAGN